MNHIVFEIISSFVTLLIDNNYNFSVILSLFIITTVVLRLIWNSVILIHGLGHVLAIAIVEKTLSVVTLNNILEQRTIKTILKSLVPCNYIFIPGLSSQNSLYISTEDLIPWRIRVKASGGISLNLITLGLGFFVVQKLNNFVIYNSGFNSSLVILFVQAFIIGNLAIALFSVSDIISLITGVGEKFYCGNFGFICQRLDTDEKVLLPERMINMYYQMGRETEIRGEQAGGGLVVASDRNNQSVFVGKKVVNNKRDNLTDSLEYAFARERKKFTAGQTPPLDLSITGVWHYRFSNNGVPSLSQTHWHQWIGARSGKFWQFVEGEWSCQRKNVDHRITHNGDFESWTIFDQVVGNRELGLWLERVLKIPNYTPGDSPKIAGMMDLLITQGMWYPSVRLAYYLTIPESIESAFDGHSPSRETADTTPSLENFKNWAIIFDHTFTLYRRLLGAPNSPSCNQYLCRLEHDILQATNDDREMSQWSRQKKVNFVRTAIHAFFHNDPYFAVKTFMSGAKGSFGLVVVSTLAPERLVLSSQGQPISIGFNWQEGYMIYASEPAAVDSVLLNLPESYRLDLNQKQGEIALVSAKEINIYSLSKGRDLDHTELRDRWISMTNHPYLTHLKYPQNNTPDPVATDSSEIPALLAEIKLTWQNSQSLNCKTANYLVELLWEKAHHFEQKRQKMMRAGLSELTRQLPTVDVLIMGIENSLWLGERFASDLKLVMPWLNIQTISTNEILQKLKYDFTSLRLGRESIVIAITQSGQTASTIQAINTFDQLYHQGIILEQFILTGELGSFLASPVIKLKKSLKKGDSESVEPEKHKIFVNGSGRRSAEPATISVAAAQQTLTELLLYIVKKMRENFPDSSPFGMTLTSDSISVLEKMKDDFLDINVVKIVGTTPEGTNINSSTKQKLIDSGLQWAWHITETPLAWAIHALYVLITVGWAIPFGYTIPLAKTVWRLIAWVTHIPQDWFLLRIIDPLIALMDIGIYIFGCWLWTIALRYFQGRQLLARVGKRTLVIGDVHWVNQILKNYVSKLFSLSYGIATLEVHGANPEDDFLHDFGHRVVRGTLLFLGVPDGRRSYKQKQTETAVIMAGKQADGVRNINVGAEVVVMGSNPEIADQGFSNAIILESNDDSVYFPDDGNGQDKIESEQKALIEELRESRFSAFERLLASYIFFWALAKKVATFPLLQYQHWKSQTRTKIMTTAVPVSSINLTNSTSIEQPTSPTSTEKQPNNSNSPANQGPQI